MTNSFYQIKPNFGIYIILVSTTSWNESWLLNWEDSALGWKAGLDQWDMGPSDTQLPVWADPRWDNQETIKLFI